MNSEEDDHGHRKDTNCATGTNVMNNEKTNGRTNEIRCVEFFSGIGGMRYGVEKALRDANGGAAAPATNAACALASCQAYEISLHANRTYAGNFRDARVPAKSKSTSKSQFSVRTKLVEQLRPDDLDGIADLWTMSPPCQPFTNTRLAKRLDAEDARCKGFKALLTLLTDIQHKPKWILLENVKHFKGSQMLALWKDCLRDCGYTWEDYLLSPTQFGIPNHRTRYYMVCERSERFRCLESSRSSSSSEIHVPSIESQEDTALSLSLSQLPTMVSTEFPMRTVSEYLREENDADDVGQERLDALVVPDHVFDKAWSRELGLVGPLDRATHCFTAAYGRQLHRATGSLLLMEPRRALREAPVDRDDMQRYKGRLRRFAPSELVRLFGFPGHFEFPEDLPLAHRYKLIGNSVNVTVISHIVSYLLRDVIGGSGNGNATPGTCTANVIAPSHPNETGGKLTECTD